MWGDARPPRSRGQREPSAPSHRAHTRQVPRARGLQKGREGRGNLNPARHPRPLAPATTPNQRKRAAPARPMAPAVARRPIAGGPATGKPCGEALPPTSGGRHAITAEARAPRPVRGSHQTRRSSSRGPGRSRRRPPPLLGVRRPRPSGPSRNPRMGNTPSGPRNPTRAPGPRAAPERAPRAPPPPIAQQPAGGTIGGGPGIQRTPTQAARRCHRREGPKPQNPATKKRANSKAPATGRPSRPGPAPGGPAETPANGPPDAPPGEGGGPERPARRRAAPFFPRPKCVCRGRRRGNKGRGPKDPRNVHGGLSFHRKARLFGIPMHGPHNI